MTLPSFVWMLTECGHAMALPPGTSGADALPTGPVYELVLRTQPSFKLLYTHKLSSNVNALASALAGHTVNGDACLVFSPIASSFTSPAVLLDSLLSSTPTTSTGTTTDVTAHQRRHPPSQQRPSPQTACGLSPGGRQQQQHRHQHQRWRLQAHPHSCPQQRQLAMRAILRGRNATAVPAAVATSAGAISTAAPRITTARGASESAVTRLASSPAFDTPARSIPSETTFNDLPAVSDVAGVEHRWSGAGVDAGAAAVVMEAATAAAVARCSWRLGGEPPCKSARSSGEFHMQWSIAALETEPRVDGPRVAAPADAVVLAPAALRAVAHAAEPQARRQPVDGAGLRTASEAAAGTALMDLDDDTDGSTVCAAGDDGGGGGGSGDGAAASAAAAAAGQAAAKRPHDGREDPEVAVPEQPPPAAVVGLPELPGGLPPADVPWGELAPDVVACVAMKLPQQASQVQAMAAVCRGWRSALLGHTPLLRRLAFTLDLVQPLHRRCTGPAASPPSPSAAQLTSTAAEVASGSPAAAAGFAAAYVACALAPVAAAAPAPGGREVGELDEAQVLADAASRQHAAGAFLLPSHGSRQLEEGQEEQAGSGWQNAAARCPGSKPTASASASASAAESEAAAVRWLLRGAGGSSALPRLLLAAASASNPTAQLVLAQLLEAADDQRGALRWWRKLAAYGDVMAMFKLGMAFYDASPGVQPDPEAAHLWLSRTVRSLLRVDSLAAISLDGHQAGGRGGSGEAAAVAAGGAAAATAAASQAGQAPQRLFRVSPALHAASSSLDAPQLHMLGWSAIVLGYLEFDGVAGRSMWGLGDRSEAVRLFRLAEAAGLAEASAVLGWLYNTGQY